MPRFPSKGTEKALLDALHHALRDLDEIRIFSSPSEALKVAELKREIRRRIAGREEPPEAVTGSGYTKSDRDRTRAFETNKHQFEKNMRDFIGLEIETGTTFATTALDSDDASRERDNTAKARKAYDTALHFIGEAQERFPNDPVSLATIERLEQLKKTLMELGEQFGG